MATTAKQNGTSKKETVTKAKQEVVKKLVSDAIKTNVNLDDRINQFEKLRGLANQRERLVNTLTELARFNYNHAESSTFSLKDAKGLEFKTTNTNLIKLVSEQLQETLEARKIELENEIMDFNL